MYNNVSNCKKTYHNIGKITNLSEKQVKKIDDIEQTSIWSIIDSTAGTRQNKYNLFNN